jgi:hypothetical protein
LHGHEYLEALCAVDILVMAITVKGTREGLTGHKTASGYVIDRIVSFVALPSLKAIHKHVRIVNPANGRSCIAEVLDVGPFNEHDDAYVFQPATFGPIAPGIPVVRPAAESGISVSGHGTNHAGIDLGEAAWAALGMKDNGNVEWTFIS